MKHQVGFLHRQTSIINTQPMKLIIKPFDSGWYFIQHIIIKFVSFIVFCSWICGSMSRDKITSLQTSVNRICSTALNIFHELISKPCLQRHKNHSKTSNGAGKFSQNLCVSKKFQYNERNCKSGRHNWRHTSMNCKSQHIKKHPTCYI